MKNKAAQSLGRLGGRAKSEAKTETARANGAKGGRPKLFAYVVETQDNSGEWHCITRIPMDREAARKECKTQREWGEKARVSKVEFVK